MRASKDRYTPAERRLVNLCFTAYVVIYITRQNLSITIPALVAEGIVTKPQAGLIISAFFWVYALGQLFSGYLGDRLPPKRMLTISLFGTALCNLLFGASRSLPVMILLSAMNGLLQSLAWAPVVALYVGVFSGEKRTRAMFSLSYTTVCGYLLAWCGFAVIRDLFGWRMTFLLPGGIALAFACVWAVWFRSPASVRTMRGKGRLKPLLQSPAMRVTLLLLMLGCTAHGLLRDSVNVWLPTMVESIEALSLFGTVLILASVPVITLVGIVVSRLIMRANKNDHYRSMRVLYVAALIPIALAFFLQRVSPTYVVLLSVGLLAVLFAINPLYTSFAPVPFEKFHCVSTVAGMVDCSIYIGSAISGVLTGLLLDAGSWQGLLWMWLIVLALAMGFVQCLQRRNV